VQAWESLRYFAVFNHALIKKLDHYFNLFVIIIDNLLSVKKFLNVACYNRDNIRLKLLLLDSVVLKKKKKKKKKKKICPVRLTGVPEHPVISITGTSEPVPGHYPITGNQLLSLHP